MMTDNTKIRPDWKVEKAIVNQINKLARHKSCTPDEMHELCLIKQIAVELKNITEYERKMLEKWSIMFDVQTLLGTLSLSSRGSLNQIVSTAILVSDTFLTQIDGKAREKEYLFTLYSKIIALSDVDKTEFALIMKQIKKNKRKMNIFKEYLKVGLR